jgi:hypothetical protein
MRPVLFAIGLGAMFAGAAQAEEAAPTAAATCQVAEVNPVTGHVFCIKPLGAPVEPPEAGEAAPCKPDRRKDAAWTWGPRCNSEPERAGS